MGSSVVERDQNGFIPGTPPPASQPGVCPAARARHHPLAQHRAAVCLHTAAARPSEHPGAMEWQEEEESSRSSSPRNNNLLKLLWLQEGRREVFQSLEQLDWFPGLPLRPSGTNSNLLKLL